MSHYEQMAIFAKVVESESFTRAAESLGLPKSTVSTQVSALERRLGVQLLQRSTRRLRLTAPGARYYAHCVRLVEVAEQASMEIAETLGRPTGVLSVTAPVNYGAVILSPLAVRFLDANPSLHIDILLVDRVVNMIEEGIDLAFRLGPLQDSNLIARGLKPVHHRLCATTGYLQGHPPAVVPEDLRHHQCLPNRPRESWLFERDGDRRRLRIKGRLSVNNLQGLKNAALAGMGIVHLPDYMCEEELRSGTLEEVLKDWPAPLTECHAVYPSTRHLPLKVRSFLDFVVESMGRKDKGGDIQSL